MRLELVNLFKMRETARKFTDEKINISKQSHF
jgi:hypothetical protein